MHEEGFGSQWAQGQYNWIVWIITIIMVIVLGWFFGKRILRNRKRRREMMEKQMEFKEEYEYLTSEKFDRLKDDELYNAVVLSCQRKDDLNNGVETLTEGEMTMYGIYQLNDSISTKSGLRSFLMSPAAVDFYDDIEKYYARVGAYEISKLIESAKHYHEVLEGIRDEDNESGDYATYNFSDYTHEYVTLVAGTNFNQKIADYIRNNKEMFVEEDENEERTSAEV